MYIITLILWDFTSYNYLDEFVLIYLNDIFIFFSDSLKNHYQKIITILKWLQQTDLQIDINKCEFKTTFTKYFKFIVEAEKDVNMNSDKIKVILKWEQSQSVKNVKFFLSFTNFYQQFIKNFFKVMTSLMNLIKKKYNILLIRQDWQSI